MKKRIALISTHGYVAAEPPLGAPDTGGQVVFVLELAQKLGLFGYEVDIWTRQFENQVEIEGISPNVRLLRVPCGSDQFIAKEYLYLNIPEWFENARHYIKKNHLSYDFINSHYWDAGIAGNLLSKELDVPHIHTPHSLGIWKREQMLADFPDSSETLEEQYNFTARIHNERIVYNFCELVIATTHIQKDKLELDYEIPENKVKVIPPGYDDNRFFPVGGATREITRQRLGFHNTTILAISRLAENKGLDLLVDGFKILTDKNPDVKLVLAVGHDDRNPQEQRIFKELLEKRENYNLQDRITFGGFIEEEDLADFYRAADVFVMSSRYEPFGMTTVEAMACGTPTVTTVHSGLYRLLEYGVHTLFADPFDKDDLGITLSKSLRYPTLRRRLSQSGAQFARARFTWTGIAQQLLNTVESMKYLPNSV